MLPPLFLASQSPRRKQLLEALGISFSVRVPNADEAEPSVADVRTGVQANALLKAKLVLDKISDPDALVIGADTLVVLKDQVLAKPSTSSDVIAMLQALSNRSHTVMTGLALVSRRFGERISTTESIVTFREITEAEMKAYSEIAEPYDKAGSYAIQGVGALFIDRIDGSYTNVMGFPIEKFLTELPLFTKTQIHDWFPARGQ